ncbi:MAG: TolC family protein [Burkholderiaceae bacterium]
MLRDAASSTASLVRALCCHWSSLMFQYAAPLCGAMFFAFLGPQKALAQLTQLEHVAAVGANTPLNLSDALQAAEVRSQSLPALEWKAIAARQRAVAARQLPDPVLRFGLDNVPVEGGSGQRFTREPTTARSIGIVQVLPGMAKREARRERFEQEAALALSRRDLQRSELRQATAMAWWTLRAELQRQTLLAAQREEAGLTVAAAEAAYRAGRGSQSDVFAARASLVALDDRRLMAQTRLRRHVARCAAGSAKSRSDAG